jgi:TrwC relaxase
MRIAVTGCGWSNANLSAWYSGVVLSAKTQMNLKNAKSYFAEHLSIGDYYGENERIHGEWLGEGAATLGSAGIVAADD